MRVSRLLIALALLSGAWYGVVYLHDQAIRQHPILPVAFEHLDHEHIKCVQCHHNYIDDTGHDSCYSCHKHDPEVALEIEEMFHDFCRDCHIAEARAGKISGPFRVCGECHHSGGRLPVRSAMIKR